MTDQGLMNYIKRSLTEGMTRANIESILVREGGWVHQDITQAFAEIDRGSSVPVAPQTNMSTSTFEKLRTWLLILIGLRLLLIPTQYFFVDVVSQQIRGYATGINSLFGLGLIGLLIPVIWFLPFVGIWKRQRGSYVTAIAFAVILVYLNMFGALAVLTNPLFAILPVIYFVSGVLIIILSSMSLKYFPNKNEGVQTSLAINESNVSLVKTVITLLFGITVIAPWLVGLSQFGLRFQADTGMILLVTFVVGAVIGWSFSNNLVEIIRKNKSWSSLVPGYGFLGGALAQFPLYGLSALQIFAVPIGGIAGIVLGFIGIGILYFIAKQILVTK
jgi:hypothetical protein